MDSLSAFEGDDGYDSPGAAIDFMPSSRLDDRRTQARLYRRWVSRLGGRLCPELAEMEARSLEGPNCVILDLRGGNDNPAVARLGAALRETAGGAEIRSVRDIPPASLLARLTGHYPAVLGTREPVAFEGEETGILGERILYRAILLPLSDGSGRIDFIAGVMNWREFADSGLAAGIAFEVGRCFADFPAREDPFAFSAAPFSPGAMAEARHPELPLYTSAP